MAKPKFDYNNNEFYEHIETLAKQGFNDSEIAYSLGLKHGVALTPQVFNRMKHGKYEGWSDEQNAERGELISQKLERGRELINGLVRSKYLNTALGNITVKGKVTTKRHMVVNGEQTEDEIVETRETEQGLPPNVQALSKWLYHNDKIWREIERGRKDEEDNGIPFDPKKGVSIAKWIEREIEDDKEEEHREE